MQFIASHNYFSLISSQRLELFNAGGTEIVIKNSVKRIIVLFISALHQQHHLWVFNASFSAKYDQNRAYFYFNIYIFLHQTTYGSITQSTNQTHKQTNLLSLAHENCSLGCVTVTWQLTLTLHSAILFNLFVILACRPTYTMSCVFFLSCAKFARSAGLPEKTSHYSWWCQSSYYDDLITVTHC